MCTNSRMTDKEWIPFSLLFMHELIQNAAYNLEIKKNTWVYGYDNPREIIQLENYPACKQFAATKNNFIFSSSIFNWKLNAIHIEMSPGNCQFVMFDDGFVCLSGSHEKYKNQLSIWLRFIRISKKLMKILNEILFIQFINWWRRAKEVKCAQN